MYVSNECCCVNRSTLQVGQRESVTSAQHNRDFTVEELKSGYVNIMAVASTGELLVSRFSERQLLVYSADGNRLYSIAVGAGNCLYDATCVGVGRIICTTSDSHCVLTISQLHGVIATTPLKDPRYLSVSNDGEICVICVADWENGVYQSQDFGKTWTLAFKPPNGWRCWQAIKVPVDSDQDDFWTLGRGKEEADYSMRIYTVDRHPTDGGLKWRDVILPANATIGHCSKLAYSSRGKVLLTDYVNRAVHSWSVSGQYDCQLLSPQHFNSSKNQPYHAAIDNRSADLLLYVGQSGGVVSVYSVSQSTDDNQ